MVHLVIANFYAIQVRSFNNGNHTIVELTNIYVSVRGIKKKMVRIYFDNCFDWHYTCHLTVVVIIVLMTLVHF